MNAPDDLVVIGPNFQQIEANALLVTPTGGIQGRLDDLLRSAAGLSSITGIINADSALEPNLPGGAIIIAGRIVPNTPSGATVSLGTTLGGSDLLPAQVVPGSASGPYGLQGVNFLEWIFATDQTIFAHSVAWAPMTITIWFVGP